MADRHRGLDALLFDLDGTLLATDDLHFEVFAEIGRDFGVPIDRDRYDAEIQGRMNAAIFAELLPGEDAAALADRKEAAFRDRLGRSAEPMPGLLALLDRAREHRLGTAVVTNAPRQNAEAMLAAIGLAHRFDVLVIGEECARGKPDPMPYSLACERLDARPERSLAFEDSRSGAASAQAAGAHVVGVRSSLDDAQLRAAGAHDTIRDFTDPVLQDVLAAFERDTA